MSYSYHDPKQNVWRAPMSNEQGFGTNFSQPPQYPTYDNPSESVALNAVQSFPYQHPSLLFPSAGYPQASYSDRTPLRFAEEAPDSTSATVSSYIDTRPTIYQGGSNQVSTAKVGREVTHSSNGMSGYWPNPRDSNPLPSPVNFVPSGTDLKSLQVDGGCHPMNSFVTYPHVGNYSRRIDGSGTWDSEPGPQRKAGSWLIAKFLDSVHSSENQSNSIPNADSAQHLQSIPVSYPAGSRPQPNVQPFVGAYSKDPVAVDLRKMAVRENPSYSWHPPTNDTAIRNASPKDSEKVVSSSKMKQDKILQKKESRVDSGTLGAWTEYFRQLYLFNVINDQHGEVQPQNPQSVDVATSLPVVPPEPVPKLGYSVSRGRGRQIQRPLAATSGPAELGIASTRVIPSKPRAAACGPTMEEKQLGCRLCGLEDMHWNAAEFQKHVSSDEHRRRYNSQIPRLDSTNDLQLVPLTLQMCCRMCNLTIAESESFSLHNRRPEHLERKALIQKGCQLCKVIGFQCYKDFALHMNGKEHKEDGSSVSSAKNAENSVNVVDSTQDKSTNPDSSGSPNEGMQTKKIDQMIVRSEKMIRTAFRPTVPQKPKIEIRLSSRQPLVGLGRKAPERTPLAGNKRTADKLDTSKVVTVEGGIGEELQKRIKIGNESERSIGSLPIFPATADATEEKNRQEISSQDDLQMVKNAAADAGNSLKDSDTATLIQAESSLMECKTNTDKAGNGTAADLLPAPSEVDVHSSSKGSTEQNNGSVPNSHNDNDVFVALVGFYCKVCRTIFNKEEVSEDEHRQSEIHRTNLKAGEDVSLSSSPGPPSSLLLFATPKHKTHDEVSLPQKNITDTSRVVHESHQETKALKQSGNAAKDDQHLRNHNNYKPLEKGISSQRLVHGNADLNSHDSARPGNHLVKHSTCKSNDLGENSAEISSPRQLGQQSTKKSKTEDGSARPVEQKDDSQLKKPALKTVENLATKLGPGKRKLIAPKSSMTCRYPQENNEDVQKKMDDILEEIVSQEEAKDIQREGQEVEKKVQTRNEEFKLRSNVGDKKPLLITNRGSLPRKLVDTGGTVAGKSNTVALAEVKVKPPEMDSVLKLATVRKTSHLRNQDKQIVTNRQNLKPNPPGMCIPLQTHFPSTSDTSQLNDCVCCNFNQPSEEQEVMTMKGSNLQSDALHKAFSKPLNDSSSTDPNSETESKKNNGTIEMCESSSMPAKNVKDGITVAVLSCKDPDVELHCKAVTKTDTDLSEHSNADVKNKGNANKHPVGNMASHDKKPDSGKTITFSNSGNSDKAATSIKHVSNVKPLANNTAVSSNTSNKAGERTVANYTSGAIEKSVPNYKMAAVSKTDTNQETDANENTLYKNKATGIMPVVEMAAAKDGTTQQNVVPAVAISPVVGMVATKEGITHQNVVPAVAISPVVEVAAMEDVTTQQNVVPAVAISPVVEMAATKDGITQQNVVPAVAISPVVGMAATKDGTTQQNVVTAVANSSVVGMAATKDGITQQNVVPTVANSSVVEMAATKDRTTQQNVVPTVANSSVVEMAATMDGTTQQNVVPAVAISPVVGMAATKDRTTQQNVVPAVVISPVVEMAATKDRTTQQNVVPTVANSSVVEMAATKDGTTQQNVVTAVANSSVVGMADTKDGTTQQNVVPTVANSSVVEVADTKEDITQQNVVPAVSISPVVEVAATKDGTTQQNVVPAVSISPVVEVAATKDGTTQQNVVPAVAISPVVEMAATKDRTTQQNVVPAVAISPVVEMAATKDGTTQQNVVPAVAISPVVEMAATKDGTTQQNVVPAVAISPVVEMAATKDGTTQHNVVSAVAISPVVVMAATKDGTTRQNVVCDKSVVDKEFADKTIVDNNNTCKATMEVLSDRKESHITTAIVNIAQPARSRESATNVVNSKTQDVKSKINRPTTVTAENDKTIKKGIGSIAGNRQTDGTTGAGSSTEEPKPVDTSKDSDSNINMKSDIASVLLPASLQKGCAVS